MPLKLSHSLNLVCGVSEALMPLAANNYLLLSLLCAIFGFTFASSYVLIPKIAEMIVGVDNFGSAIGLNFFMQGLGLLIGTPFAGWLYEISGRYETFVNDSFTDYLFSQLVVLVLCIRELNSNQ